MFGRRPDGQLVRDAAPIRRFIPFVSPRRGEALVFLEQRVSVDAALAALDRLNADRPREARITLFHLVLRALARTIEERTQLNRFVAGDRLWQRDGVWLSFSAKQQFNERAPILTLKRRFEPSESVEAMADDVLGRLGRGRSGERSTSDKEMGLLLKLPPFLVRWVMGLARLADRVGLLPRSMIDSDPLYASAFVANLGSLGIERAFHHLWEWGNCPIFLVMGRISPGPTGQELMLCWSYDERIADGFYGMTGLALVKGLLEEPERLIGPPTPG
ncbi:MAG: hypothetical protein R3F60_11220 [bacterium]